MAILKRTKAQETAEAAASAAPAKKTKAPAATAKARKSSGDAYRVLMRPVITEKAAQLATSGIYLFEVGSGVDKVEVRTAVRDLYGVLPRRVNILNRKGKQVRYGRVQGKRSATRLAYVYLPEGKHIDLYEGV